MKLRLQTLISFIDSEDKVVDIGCDHAYLAIYLKENRLCQKVIATDINKNALEIARKNITEHHLDQEIMTYLSDGLKNINDYDIDTLVIAGMGTSTILDITKDLKKFPIKKLIIQSNNNLEALRTILRKRKIYLQEEKIIYEKNHYYVIGKYTKEYNSLSLREKLFGKYNSKYFKYYKYLNKELININQKITFRKNFRKKFNIIIKRILLKKYL